MTYLGGGDPRNWNLAEIFVQSPIPTKFHHPVFNYFEVIVLTNKQTNMYAKRFSRNIHLASLCYAGGEKNQHSFQCLIRVGIFYLCIYVKMKFGTAFNILIAVIMADHLCRLLEIP